MAEAWDPSHAQSTPWPMTLCRVPWLSVMGSLTPSVSSSGLENTTSRAVTKVLPGLPRTAQPSPLGFNLYMCATGPSGPGQSKSVVPDPLPPTAVLLTRVRSGGPCWVEDSGGVRTA